MCTNVYMFLNTKIINNDINLFYMHTNVSLKMKPKTNHSHISHYNHLSYLN